MECPTSAAVVVSETGLQPSATVSAQRMQTALLLLLLLFFITARRKATRSFESAVYATANPSVRLSVCLSARHTPVLCQNDGTQMRSSPSGSSVSLCF